MTNRELYSRPRFIVAECTSETAGMAKEEVKPCDFLFHLWACLSTYKLQRHISRRDILRYSQYTQRYTLSLGVQNSPREWTTYLLGDPAMVRTSSHTRCTERLQVYFKQANSVFGFTCRQWKATQHYLHI